MPIFCGSQLCRSVWEGPCVHPTCDSDREFRCVFSSNCKAGGELCGSAEDCCNGQCVSSSGEAPRCLVTPGCKVGGEPCPSSGECCSKACADNGAGTPTCQLLGGCRPACEVCNTDADCCSGSCTDSPSPGSGCSSGFGFKRCNLIEGPKSPGEVCAAGGVTLQPCGVRPLLETGMYAACGTRENDPCCLLVRQQVSRCFGGPLVGGQILCLSPGMTCAFNGECCSGQCSSTICR